MTAGAETLVRRGKRNARFTAISNDLIDHPDLSPEARIVLIYLLSKPDNWKLRIHDIRRLLGTSQKACGRNKTYEVIRELRSCAHVIAVEELQGGRFHRMTYFVFDELHCDPEGFARAVRDGRDYGADAAGGGQNSGASPRTENLDTAPEPCPEKPRPENRHIITERERNVSTTMRRLGLEFRLGISVWISGLMWGGLIHAAVGRFGGAGMLLTKRFGLAAKAFSRVRLRAA